MILDSWDQGLDVVWLRSCYQRMNLAAVSCQVSVYYIIVFILYLMVEVIFTKHLALIPVHVSSFCSDICKTY
jgi:hypothetical protein